MRARPMPHSENAKTDVAGTKLGAWSRRFGLHDSPQDHSPFGARAEQASLQRAIALMVVPLLCVLVVAAIGLGSALVSSDFLRWEPTNTSAGMRGVSVADAVAVRSSRIGQNLGLAGAISSLKLRRGAQIPAESTQESGVPVLQSAVDSGTNLLASAVTTVAQTIAPESTTEIPPAAEPGAGTPAVAVATGVGASAAGSRSQTRGTITIETFGYGFGEPPDGCKFVADVRNIDVAGLSQYETGLMPSVRDRVMATSAAQTWMEVLRTQWMPSLKDGDHIAIGCVRGHHRSVTLAVIFAEDLRARGYAVNLVHRDILKTY